MNMTKKESKQMLLKLKEKGKKSIHILNQKYKHRILHSTRDVNDLSMS